MIRRRACGRTKRPAGKANESHLAELATDTGCLHCKQVEKLSGYLSAGSALFTVRSLCPPCSINHERSVECDCSAEAQTRRAFRVRRAESLQEALYDARCGTSGVYPLSRSWGFGTHGHLPGPCHPIVTASWQRPDRCRPLSVRKSLVGPIWKQPGEPYSVTCVIC